MLNLEETLSSNSDYTTQRDLYWKGFLYSFSIVVFIDSIRSQVAEINLLQLIPGFYLVLLFSSLIFVIFTSDLFFRIPFEIDNKKEFGTKTPRKIQFSILLRFSFFFTSIILAIALNAIIPLSLDSFNYFGENTLENTWSFDEVINLELLLVFLLLILVQFPIAIISYLTTEKDANRLPEAWKILIILSIVVAGIVTPTIDGYTQFSFALSAIIFYLIIINIIEKRINVKFCGLNALT